LRQRTPSSAVVLGENTPQISWYADRRAVSFPPREGFAAALAKVDWVLFTNFERGQPAWAAPLAAQIARHRSASGEVYLFRDPRFATLLARSSWLASRLSATEQGLSLSEDP
jgi:hypothetical protein